MNLSHVCPSAGAGKAAALQANISSALLAGLGIEAPALKISCPTKTA